MNIKEVKVYFRDETKPDKRGKELTEKDKQNWFWGIIALLEPKEKQNDPELEVQKMYKRILIF